MINSMRIFKTVDELVNSFALQNLKSFFIDLKAWGETRNISEIKEEILKERRYTLKTKVGQQFHAYTAKMENVHVAAYYIKNFGYVEN